MFSNVCVIWVTSHPGCPGEFWLMPAVHSSVLSWEVNYMGTVSIADVHVVKLNWFLGSKRKLKSLHIEMT